MISTILLDLDGTLLFMDFAAFAARYLQALAGCLPGPLPPERRALELYRWNQAMAANQEPSLTRAEFFWRGFPAAIGAPRPDAERAFADFHRRYLPRLRPDGTANPLSRRLVQILFDRGHEVVIATNPVFPREALLQRLEWAGCLGFPYLAVTGPEEMHFSKPSLEYFTELLALTGREPGECLMIGNDMEEDMIAQRLGITCALVTDCLIDRGLTDLIPDWQGTLAELVRELAAGAGLAPRALKVSAGRGWRPSAMGLPESGR